MTLPPHILETLATLLGWLLTYLVHSTLLLGGAWLLTRGPARVAHLRETVWRVALLGALVTTTAQVTIAHAPLAGEWRWAAPMQVEVRSERVRAARVAGAHDGAVPSPRMRVSSGVTARPLVLVAAWRVTVCVPSVLKALM